MELFLQITTALASIGTFGAFIMLFIKDKDKKRQIERLSNIALSLENQSDYLQKQNELIAQQVDIFRNTSILKGQDESAIKKLQEIEEKKLRLSVKPNLWLNGGLEKGSSGELHIDLNNKGEVAKLLEFNLTSEDITLHNLHLPYDLEKGSRRYIFAKSTGKQIRNCEYMIEIIYTDSLNNKYKCTLKGTGANAKIIEDIAN